MFNNPVYNLPAQFNESLAALSLNNNSAPSHVDHHQRQNIDFASFQFQQQQQQSNQIHHLRHQQQQMPISIGNYAPPSLNEVSSTIQWPSPDELNDSYQRGSTVVRQYNNSMIDDYYKKFLRPITDYVAIPTNGQPTYVYQNLGGATSAPTTNSNPLINNSEVSATHAVVAGQTQEIAQPKAEGSEEKKHKKKHKKRSSKHSHGDGTKQTDAEKASGNEERAAVAAPAAESHDYQTPAAPAASGAVVQRSPLRDASGNFSGAIGPQVPMRFDSNPVVYFDIEIDGEARGRIVMELFRHVLPRTAQNFLALAVNEHGFGFRLSYFHRIIPGFMAQGGDFEKSNGTGGYSIYGEKFDDEGFPYPHDRPGLLSMANSGPNTNGSQFFITFVPCPHLDNKHVVFGQVLQGFHLLKDLEMSGSESGEVLREVKIAASDQFQ